MKKYTGVEILSKLPSPVLIRSVTEERIQARYVHGSWDHILPGQNMATQVRFVFDRDVGSVTSMQIEHGGRWSDAGRNDIADVEDSLKTANDGAIEHPYVWGLEEGPTQPSWASPPSATAKAEATTSVGQPQIAGSLHEP